MFSGRWAAEFFAASAGLLYPPHCAGCDVPLPARWGRLCRACRRRRTKLQPPRCAVCGQPFGGVVPERFRCMNCGDLELAFEFATAAYRSRGVTRELIHRFKYGHHLHLRHLLGKMLADGFRDERVTGDPVEAIVPVPLHATKKREREFNQAEVLARVAGRRLGLPVEDCLRRRRYTRTQTHLHRDERFENLDGAFVLRRRARVEGRRLALVDDVLTTGSTADACARVLREAGAAAVVVITVARG